MDGVPERDSSPSFRRRFSRIVCRFEAQIYILFVIEFALLLLTGYSILFTGFDGASGVIITFNIIILGGAMIMTVALLVLCRLEREG